MSASEPRPGTSSTTLPSRIIKWLVATIAVIGVTTQMAAIAAEQTGRRHSPNNPPVGRPGDGQPGPGDAEPHDRGDASFPAELRTIDGTGNNGAAPGQGAAGIELLRMTTVAYGDGAGSPAGNGLASAREVSNLCAAQDAGAPAASGISDFFWQWGQFLDHDIDLTPILAPTEAFDIPVPAGDAWFDPAGSGDQVIPLDRSLYNVVGGVRQQMNAITAFIDASNVYGSDQERADELRTMDGTGRLKTSAGDLLPFNENGLDNAPSGAASYFLAGDIRANEQVGLTALHTLFVREHNYWAGRTRAESPQLSGDDVYERARAIVGAEMQAITYREFLPVLLGRKAIPRYRGYDESVDASIANVFATAAYRLGHSMLSAQLLRLDGRGNEIAAGNLSLADAFFSPDEITGHGIAPLLRGLASQQAQEIDAEIVDEVRNFLFGPPGAGGFDLAALNIQRGRDHGLPGYNQVRVDYGLAPVSSFADVNPDVGVQARLAAAYGSVDDIDLWVGGLAESHARKAVVGETFHAVLADQFTRLRDGDRFWYESYLPRDMVKLVNRQTLATIVKRNTEIERELGRKPFLVKRSRRARRAR